MRNLGWTVGLLSLLAVASATAARAQRLPGEAVPRHYEIHLAPNLASGELKGEETIDVEIPQATPTITLNAVGLELRASATAAGKGLAEPAARPAAVALDPARETATLRFEPPLPAGAARLAVEFTGRVRDDLRGLYRVQAAGRRYAITQFEGTYARMMFPCFDEPADKATFDLTVTVAQGDTAISNGAVVADRPGPAAGLHTLTFGTSPRMSTYLVALAVGEFQCVAGGADGIPIRVCALPEKKELGRFALAASERFLRFYNGYYGIRYPFGKLDMVAFPDYEWGGMENTAAIFYKERALLIDAASASAWSRRGVAAVVAHEMAHQWFGDLVTMRWWDDVWLNEGFATWMSGKPLAEWDRTWDQDVEAAQAAQGVLEADSLASTRPIRQNGETPAEIKELFDGVAYQKGAAMLRMVESYLGEPVFQAGVNAYLSRHAGGNATAEDLWSELARVSSRPVDRVLASFVEQPGAPLLAIETRCQGDTTEVTLSQQRFFLDPRRLAAGSPELWSIPVCLRPAGGDGGAAVRCELLRERRQSFTLDGCFPWVLANAGARGYYRSSYPPETLRKIAAAASAFSPAELVALLDDQWALVRVGRTSIADYLALAQGLQGSRERAVASLLIDRLQYVGNYLVEEGDRERYRSWLASLLKPAAQELGFAAAPGDSDDRKTLRATVFQALGNAGDPQAIAAARRLAEQALHAPAAVDANLASAALRIAARNGDAALYDRFLAAMSAAPTPEWTFRFLSALTAFRDEALIRRSLDLALSPRLRAQDLPAFTSQLLANPAGQRLAWEFLKAHWPELQTRVVSFGGGGAVGALGSICEAGMGGDVERFFAAHRAPGAERTVRHSLEDIRNCVELKSRQQKPLHDWLQRSAAAAR